MPELPSWLRVLRGVVLMGVGALGMVWLMFLRDGWDWGLAGLFLSLIAGEGAWSGLWLIIRAASTLPPSSSPPDSSSPSE